jgi:transcriptional regulator with XRE-family HTH domain
MTKFERKKELAIHHRVASFRRLNLSYRPPKYTARYSKATFIKALIGSRGIHQTIAERLGCSVSTIDAYINRDREGWDEVRLIYAGEKATFIDAAEKAIDETIEQRMDVQSRLNAAKWALSKLKKDVYGDRVVNVHEGGKTPIKTISATIDISSLNLPIEVQRQILEAMDKQEKTERDKEFGPPPVILPSVLAVSETDSED